MQCKQCKLIFQDPWEFDYAAQWGKCWRCNEESSTYKHEELKKTVEELEYGAGEKVK